MASREMLKVKRTLGGRSSKPRSSRPTRLDGLKIPVRTALSPVSEIKETRAGAWSS